MVYLEYKEVSVTFIPASSIIQGFVVAHPAKKFPFLGPEVLHHAQKARHPS
jgi:hypothetical protein